MPTVADLVRALPADAQQVVRETDDDRLREIFENVSHRSVPSGALRRLGSLGSLQAKIGLAFTAYIVRGWFQGAEQKEQSKAEAYLSVGLHTLETMAYLRGAIMKVGQMSANLPDIVPSELTDVLSHLHFQAPPMHFSLLREQLENELDSDVEDIFAEFDRDAFAAASLGQVHRATLRTGQQVAVKVQYPGIARAIKSDLRNLSALALPLRLGKGWANVGQQLEEIRTVMGAETDYEQEAENLIAARSLFGEGDQIVVPRVYRELSTRRVLTMEWIDGKNFQQFLDAKPDQSLRNHYGCLMSRGQSRLYYRSRTLYADPHPGNYLFMDGGRLGLIDFGCMRRFNDEEWDYLRRADMSIGSDRETVIGHLQRGMELTKAELNNREFMDLAVRWCEWVWEPSITDGPFDFADTDHFRAGIDMFTRLGRKFRPRNKPVNLFVLRWHFAHHAVLYRLKSCFNVAQIVAEERKVTGWEHRSEQP